MSDDESSNRQKPTAEALAAIRATLMAPLPTYKHDRPRQPLKPEKTIERRNADARDRSRSDS